MKTFHAPATIVPVRRNTLIKLFAIVVTGLHTLCLPVVLNASDARSANFVDVKLLSNTKQSWIAKRMTINGVPTSIRSIENNEPLQDVIEHYKAAWSEQEEVIQRQHGEWQILLTKKKDNFISLHLKSNGHGTEGRLLISGDPQHYKDNATTSLPLPHAFKTLSRQEHLDGEQNAESITMSSRDDVGAVRSTLLSSLTADGWKVVYDKPTTQVGRGYSLQLTRSRDVIKVFIGRDADWGDDTLVLLTWLKQQA